MEFGPVPLDSAEGAVLGHNLVGPDGRRLLRKGKALTGEDLALLRSLGRKVVYAAVLGPGDVDEDTAALRITQAVVDLRGLRLSGPSTGRVNLHATALGLVRVEVEALARLNQCEGVTLATLANHTPVRAGRMVATTKILPYALDRTVVEQAERLGASAGPVLRVDGLAERRVGLIVSGSHGGREKAVASFETVLRQRIEALGSHLDAVDFVALEEESGAEELAAALRSQLAAGAELVLLAGETAIQDRRDLAPRAVELAGGEVTCFGAPVDPGNLLMLGYVGRVPVVGAPGCARSPKHNIVDLVLPRLLAGDRLERSDIVGLGHGGLLEDVPERPLPRSRL